VPCLRSRCFSSPCSKSSVIFLIQSFLSLLYIKPLFPINKQFNIDSFLEWEGLHWDFFPLPSSPRRSLFMPSIRLLPTHLNCWRCIHRLTFDTGLVKNPKIPTIKWPSVPLMKVSCPSLKYKRIWLEIWGLQIQTRVMINIECLCPCRLYAEKFYGPHTYQLQMLRVFAIGKR